MSRSVSKREPDRLPVSPAPAPNVPGPPAQGTPLESLLEEMRLQKRGRGSMLGANFETALEALWANPLRTSLTILGIFIGVAAVIAALTLTQGVGAYINNLINIGGNTITIYAGAARGANGAAQGRGSGSTLTQADARTLQRLPYIAAVSPVLVTSQRLVFRNQSWTTSVEGVNSDLQNIQTWTIASGNWFTTADDNSSITSAVLGDTVYHNLFDASGINPIGQQIRIGSQIFRVTGILNAQGGFATQDDVVFVPLKTAQLRLNNTSNVSQILVSADSSNDVTKAQALIETTLRRNHNLKGTASDDFNIFTAQSILQSISATTSVITYLLVGIAAISLMVGGVGIMNIMLVSVTERTWEIGIRMSIGARRADIRNQFLMEALLLCIIGGVFGLGLGLLAGYFVTKVSGLPFIVSVVTVTLPFAVSAAISLVFGLYPAIRASRLDPIVAIRTEE